MANDRLYVVCDVCKSYLYLGKFYPSHSEITWDRVPAEEVKDFVNKHIDTCQWCDADLMHIRFCNEATVPAWVFKQ